MTKVANTVESKKAKDVEQNEAKTGESKVAKTVEVRGMPKCGRFWKTPKTKFSSINKTKGLKLSFERKQKLREDIKKTRELSRSLINERNAENEARKERRRENIKRRAENQRKSEVVQLIKNPAKIKRMRKKALRQIEKRDTLNMK